ncbi:MAG: RNA polymerase sigma factor, partial [Geodermatophilaceae bacterium]|nr:RNA polymerase sigma factor [Geodermatophilaceae bacterium]
MDHGGVEDLLRSLAHQVLGAVTRRTGDFDAAEDAVQEALLAAAGQWPAQGLPDNPRGWLVAVALRRFTDDVRSEIARRRREEQVGPGLLGAADATPYARDDSLSVLFLCCHPALTPASAIALTLRAVGGLSTAEIAHAFLVPEATMAQRISRAKRTVRDAGATFAMPSSAEFPARLAAVLQVLYLLFNEGYTASGGPVLQRVDLSAEAIRLARSLRLVLPDEPELSGLLALMLLTDARRPARSGPAGELVPLAAQDRARWDADLVAEGVGLLTAALPGGAVGPYQLQAAIAAVHDEATDVASTDWAQILALYGLLERMAPNPVVSLNRAVAVAMVHGPEAALAVLGALADRLGEHHRWHAARAHLLELAGDAAGAAAAFVAASIRTTSTQ